MNTTAIKPRTREAVESGALVFLTLAQLRLSPRNVRKTESKKAMKALKASIEAHGLITSLAVADADEAFEVIDGGRRLQAITELVAEGRLDAAFPIACRVVEAERLDEISLAANTQRAAMHPADEFEAFAQLIEEGLDAEQVAIRFGCDTKRVEQRMKLAKVHPDLIKAFRAGKMKLKALEAFTISADQKQQLAVWKKLPDWAKDRPDAIRKQLTEKLAAGDSQLAAFVGLEAYEAAGGKLRRDLFGENVYLEDIPLLHRLAGEKLEAKQAELLKEGWKWVEIGHQFEWSYTNKFHRVYGKSKKEKAVAGCLVAIDAFGDFSINTGLVKKEDKKELKKLEGGQEEPGKEKKKELYSQSLEADLKSARTQAAQVFLALDSNLAFDLLVFNLASQVLDKKSPYGQKGVDISLDETDISSSAEKLDDSPAAAELQRLRSSLDTTWTKEKHPDKRFLLFREVKEEAKHAILAYCTAMALNKQLSTGNGFRKDDVTEAALQQLEGASPAAYWRPTKQNFLGRISKEQLLAIGEELLGKEWLQRNRNLSKGGLADALDKVFANPNASVIRLEQVQKIKAWLPKGMEFAAPAKKGSK